MEEECVFGSLATWVLIPLPLLLPFLLPGKMTLPVHHLFTEKALSLACEIRDSTCRCSGESGAQGWPRQALAVTKMTPRLLRVPSRPTLLVSEQTERDAFTVTIEFLLIAVHVSLAGLTIQVKSPFMARCADSMLRSEGVL